VPENGLEVWNLECQEPSGKTVAREIPKYRLANWKHKRLDRTQEELNKYTNILFHVEKKMKIFN
jgi:hypothetical protein